MFEGVFDDRLQEHAGNKRIERMFLDLLVNLKIVAAEPGKLDIEVIVDEVEVLLQRNKRLMLSQQPTQNVPQFDHHPASRVRIVSNHRNDGVQRTEPKLRLELR